MTRSRRRRTALALVALPLAVLLVACEPDPTAVLTVDAADDAVDESPGDGTCATAAPARCTLRAAVQEANALTGHQRIVVPPGLTVELSLTGGGEDAAAGGDIDVTDSLGIHAAGATIRSAGLDDRLLDLHDAPLWLRGGTWSQGTAYGQIGDRDGGNVLVRSGGELVAEAVRLDLGRAYGDGGNLSVADGGRATVAESALARGEAALGGGVAVAGDLDLSRSSITDGSGGGIAVSGRADVLATTIDGPRAGSAAGAYAWGAGRLSLRSVTVVGTRGDGVRADGAAEVHATGSLFGEVDLTSGQAPGCSTRVVSGGGNVDTDGSCVVAGADRPHADTRVEPRTSVGAASVVVRRPRPGTVAVDGGTGCGYLDVAFSSRPTDGDGDGAAACDAGAVELPPRDGPPVASGDAASVPEGSTFEIDVLGNDDLKGAGVADVVLSIDQAPLHGDAEVVAGTGRIRYSAPTSSPPQDQLGYRVCRGAACDTATLAISVPMHTDHSLVDSYLQSDGSRIHAVRDAHGSRIRGAVGGGAERYETSADGEHELLVSGPQVRVVSAPSGLPDRFAALPAATRSAAIAGQGTTVAAVAELLDASLHRAVSSGPLLSFTPMTVQVGQTPVPLRGGRPVAVDVSSLVVFEGWRSPDDPNTPKPGWWAWTGDASPVSPLPDSLDVSHVAADGRGGLVLAHVIRDQATSAVTGIRIEHRPSALSTAGSRTVATLPNGSVSHLAVAPDGETVATGARILDLTSGRDVLRSSSYPSTSLVNDPAPTGTQYDLTWAPVSFAPPPPDPASAGGRLAWLGGAGTSLLDPVTGARREDGRIWVTDATGSTPSDAAGVAAEQAGRGQPNDPDISPDGDRVAYVTYVSTGTTSRYLLHTVTVDGRRVERIVDDEYTSPQMPDWSPSGDRLAFVARHPTDGTWGVWVRDQATGAATQLTRVAPPCPQGCDAWPTFTPDGLHVLFVRGRMLHAVPAAGGAAVALSGVTSSDTPSKAGVAADALVWTTGGTQVISAAPPAWSVTAATLRFQLGGGTSWMATRPGTSALAFHAGGQGVSVTTTQGDRPRVVAAQPGRELSWSDGW